MQKAKLKKPGKVALKTPADSDITETAVTLKWNKVKKATGYQIFKDGKKIKTIKGGSKLTYMVTGLKADTKYTFKIRAIKKVKVKSWYNIKAKKWQFKQPYYKYWKRSKKVKKTVVGKFSSIKTVRTDPVEAEDSSDDELVFSTDGTFEEEEVVPVDLPKQEQDPEVDGTDETDGTQAVVEDEPAEDEADGQINNVLDEEAENGSDQ